MRFLLFAVALVVFFVIYSSDTEESFGVSCYEFNEQTKLKGYFDFDFTRDKVTINWNILGSNTTHVHDITEKSNVFIRFGTEYDHLGQDNEMLWFFDRETLILTFQSTENGKPQYNPDEYKYQCKLPQV